MPDEISPASEYARAEETWYAPDGKKVVLVYDVDGTVHVTHEAMTIIMTLAGFTHPEDGDGEVE